MASRKEEKERLRKAREEAERQERSQERKRLIFGYAVAGVISAAVLVGIVFAIVSGGDGGGGGGEREGFGTAGHVPEGAVLDEREGAELAAQQQLDLDAAVEEAGCELSRDMESDGNQHFTDEDRVPQSWSTRPPATGDHYGVPTEQGSGALATGPYAETPPMSRVVHALEHGRIAIQYSPELPEQQQLLLKGIYDELEPGVILFPNDDMEADVSVTAWVGGAGGQLLQCDSVNEQTVDAIRAFRDEFRGLGPEPVPFEL